MLACLCSLFQVADDVLGQAGGHTPDGVALPIPDGDLHPAPGPAVVRRNPHGLIGKVPRHVRLQGIDILLRSGLPKKARGTVNASPTSAGEGATAAKPAAETSPSTGCIRKPA